MLVSLLYTAIMNRLVQLPVILIKEAKYFVAYSPALELSTSGKTEEQAKKRFSEVVNIFFEEVEEKGTLNEVLTELGWQKVNSSWSPPQVISHMEQEVRLPHLV